MYYLNVQSLVKHHSEIQIFIEKYQPSLIFLSETHVTSDIEECEVAIKGYKYIGVDSHSRHTGGVAMYLKNSVKFKVICTKNFNNNANKFYVFTLKML